METAEIHGSEWFKRMQSGQTIRRSPEEMQGKKMMRLFFATDIHGSERCFRKFVRAAKFYKADILVLGGDITGKFVIPIVDHSNGTYKADFVGTEMTANTGEQLKSLERMIADSGYYYYHCGRSEMDDLKASKERVDTIFLKVMQETLAKWLSFAEETLRESGTLCYITGGNDDLQEVIDGIADTEHVRNPDNQVVQIDPYHEMASLGWSNPTPWKCPRECSEEELAQRVDRLLSSVSDLSNCVLNFHTPPLNCLDLVSKLDDSVYPPKPVLERGQPVMVPAGSASIYKAIEKYEPLIDLCGHVHESKGTCKVGRTLIVNPGSEYSEGVLRGAIVNLADKKIMSWQLTSG